VNYLPPLEVPASTPTSRRATEETAPRQKKIQLDGAGDSTLVFVSGFAVGPMGRFNQDF
jgi:hypothetical protein